MTFGVLVKPYEKFYVCVFMNSSTVTTLIFL